MTPNWHRGRHPLQDLLDADDKRRKDIEQRKADLAVQDWQQFKQRVRDDMRHKAEARQAEAEAVAKMTPEQYANYREHKKAEAPIHPERFAKYTVIAMQEIRAEDQAKQAEARRQREEELGLPKARESWRQALDAIRETAARERAEQEQDHEGALAAIREREQAAEEELGPEPSLEMFEAQEVPA